MVRIIYHRPQPTPAPGIPEELASVMVFSFDAFYSRDEPAEEAGTVLQSSRLSPSYPRNEGNTPS